MITDWLFKLIHENIASKITGKIEINFFDGGITNVMIKESVRPPTQ